MSVADGRSMAREIAGSLTRALEEVLAPTTTPAAMVAARGAAQLLNLEGLDRLLEACQAHVGRAWPPELQPAIGRLARLASECVAAGDPEVFRGAEAELSALAAELRALEWSEERGPSGARTVVPTLSLSDVLEDSPVLGEESQQRTRQVRLTAPVAAALRAALDWLTEDDGARAQPLRIAGEATVLEVVCSRVNPAGLYPAAKVLSTAGGSLGPMLGADPRSTRREWLVRVPTFAGRNTYLMLVQGSLQLALPWHAALRLYMVPSAELDSRIDRLDLPVLPALSPSANVAAERPIVLVAHGLKRAYLVADRLVWRLEAEAFESGQASPGPALTRCVRTEEGETYWVADPEWLLEKVEIPVPPLVSPARPLPEAELPVLGPEHVEPLDEEDPAAAPPAPPSSPSSPSSVETAEVPAGRARQAETQPPPTAPEAALAAPPTEAPEPERVARPAEAAAPDTAHIALPAEAAAPEAAPAAAAAEAAAPEAAPIAPPGGPVGREPLPARPPAESTSPQAPSAAAPPLALVAEDSITARIFLTRLLEQQGFSVRAVSSATELHAELDAHAWSLVCLDIELPDGGGVELLRSVAASPAVLDSAVPVVALVRDAADVAASSAAGVWRTLRKPFDREALERLIGRLGFAGGESR